LYPAWRLDWRAICLRMALSESMRCVQSVRSEEL
jgi:hypothetical protein